MTAGLPPKLSWVPLRIQGGDCRRWKYFMWRSSAKTCDAMRRLNRRQVGGIWEPGLTKSNRALTSFYSFSEFPTYWEEVRQWWTGWEKCNSQQIMVGRNNWTTSKADPEFRSKETDRNFNNLCIGIMANIRGLHVSMHCSIASEVMANIHGLHVSMHCSIASEVMERFLSFF